jgi:mRNA interferase RelE/StbE
MAKYKIFFKESVRKDFKPIRKSDVTKILQHINTLTEKPRISGCEKLTDRENYRIRLGRYRILYSIQDRDKTVWIIKIAHRKDVYRG